MNKLIISLFVLGLSFGIGPCLASCGPLLISYVAGTRKNIPKSIAVYILFCLSRILVYTAVSLSLFLFSQATGYVLGSWVRYLFILGGLFILVIGLFMAFGKNLEYKIWQKIQDFFFKYDAKTVVIFGLIVGLLPCAPLISVVSYIGLIARNWLNAVLYSLAFGLGTMVSPLFLLVVFAGLIPKFMRQERSYRIFNFVCGLIIVFLGLQLMRRAF